VTVEQAASESGIELMRDASGNNDEPSCVCFFEDPSIEAYCIALSLL
jgi:hypothetical protein